MKKLTKTEITKRLYQSIATTSQINVPAPEGLEYLPFQKAGIEYMQTSSFKRHLIGDPPGLGKTIQAIGYINLNDFKRGLIIVPASLLLNWQEELNTWLVAKKEIQVIRGSKVKLDPQAHIYIVSYTTAANETLKKQFDALEKFDYLIVDESHYLKNPKAQRTKAVIGAKGYINKANETLFLSGTQMLNRPIELYGILDKACPQAINHISWFTYARKFCGAYKDGFGWNVDGSSNEEELGQRLRAYFMVRRRKNKVLTQLPPKRTKIVFFESDRKSKKIMTKMVDFDADALTKGKISAGFDGLSEARRELGELIVDPSVKYLKEKLENGEEKIIVFAHHKSVIKALEEGLAEYGVVSIKGVTSTDDRHKAVKSFQNDPNVRVFVGSITAAGVGITLTAASYVAFVEASWVPGENQQAVDRAHRLTQENPVLAEFFVFRGSLQEKILKAHISKNKVIKKVMA